MDGHTHTHTAYNYCSTHTQSLSVLVLAVEAKPTEESLRKHICNEVGTGWEEVCTFLGIAYKKISEIKSNNQLSTKEVFFQCLIHWADGNTNKAPTWLALLEALELADLKGMTTPLKMRILNDRL